MKRKMSIATATAHLTGPGKLKVSNTRLTYAVPGKPPLVLDAQSLEKLFCYGGITFSDEALLQLCKHNVEVALLSSTGARCHGRLVTGHSSSSALRLAQYQATSELRLRLPLARQLVRRKLESQQEACRHFQRHGTSAAGGEQKKLLRALPQCDTATGLDSLRGIEGSATAGWFRVFAQLLKSPWSFAGRQKRPPRDPVNSLLSLGYTWLIHRLTAAIEARGLDPNLGVMHEFRHGRPSLACDLIEPLRIPCVDRWVITICNRQQLDPQRFTYDNERGCRLPQGAFGEVLASWEEHLCKQQLVDTIDQQVEGICREFRQAG